MEIFLVIKKIKIQEPSISKTLNRLNNRSIRLYNYKKVRIVVARLVQCLLL